MNGPASVLFRRVADPGIPTDSLQAPGVAPVHDPILISAPPPGLARTSGAVCQGAPRRVVPAGRLGLPLQEELRLAASIGRQPCFRPKKYFVARGMSKWGRMLVWCRDHSGGFYRTYGRRNTIESCFSAIKDRFNFRIRSVTLEMQRCEIAILSICRNLCLIVESPVSPGTRGGDCARTSGSGG